MNDRTFKLYTGEKLDPFEEMQLIKELISESQLDIDIYQICIDANKKNIDFFKERLSKLEAEWR